MKYSEKSIEIHCHIDSPLCHTSVSTAIGVLSTTSIQWVDQRHNDAIAVTFLSSLKLSQVTRQGKFEILKEGFPAYQKSFTTVLDGILI